MHLAHVRLHTRHEFLTRSLVRLCPQLAGVLGCPAESPDENDLLELADCTGG
jgi:hypothetical protein